MNKDTTFCPVKELNPQSYNHETKHSRSPAWFNVKIKLPKWVSFKMQLTHGFEMPVLTSCLLNRFSWKLKVFSGLLSWTSSVFQYVACEQFLLLLNLFLMRAMVSRLLDLLENFLFCYVLILKNKFLKP